MSVNIGDFVGTWTVEWIDGRRNWMSAGWQILIGTGSSQYGDKEPYLTPEYVAAVGFAVLDGDGQVKLSTGNPPGNQPLALIFDGGQLRWAGSYEQEPLRIYISLSKVELLDGETVNLSLYGSTVWGDPDQVGVWGGSGTGGGGGAG